MIGDGGLATTLQERGLPPFTPVDGWLLGRPDEVARAHRAFVDAGATWILTGTFRALPGLRPRWEAVVDRAVEAATIDGVEVWGSIGPGGDRSAWRRLAARLAPHVAGLVLETFADPDEAVEALSAVADLAPTVALLTVRDDGRRYDGGPVGPALARLLGRGAVAAGIGCGEPDGAEAVVASWDGPPLWARPGRARAPAEVWLATATRLLDRCARVGGCCGVSPPLVAALAAARSPRA